MWIVENEIFLSVWSVHCIFYWSIFCLELYSVADQHQRYYRAGVTFLSDIWPLAGLCSRFYSHYLIYMLNCRDKCLLASSSNVNHCSLAVNSGEQWLTLLVKTVESPRREVDHSSPERCRVPSYGRFTCSCTPYDVSVIVEYVTCKLSYQVLRLIYENGKTDVSAFKSLSHTCHALCQMAYIANGSQP